MTATGLLLVFSLIWLLVIAVMDLRIHKVRNWIVLLGLAIGIVALFSGAHPFQVSPLSGLLGMLVAFMALLSFYTLGWMGAGDVKFAAVLGLWLGLNPALLAIWVGGSLLAGLHSIVVVAWSALRHRPLGLWLQTQLGSLGSPTQPLELHLNFVARNRTRSIPYAGYMAIAAIGLMLWSRT